LVGRGQKTGVREQMTEKNSDDRRWRAEEGRLRVSQRTEKLDCQVKACGPGAESTKGRPVSKIKNRESKFEYPEFH
jgi:hypothetical protein